MDCCVDVAVANAALTFDKLYTYLVPERLAEYAAVGARVAVPFGNGAPRMGIILAPAAFREGLREVLDVERETPLLNSEMVRLIFLLREQTLCSYYDAMTAVLPKNSRLSALPGDDGAGIRRVTRAHTETVFRRADAADVSALTEKQRGVLRALSERALTYAEIREQTGASRDLVGRLVKKGTVITGERDKTVRLYERYERRDGYELTAEQRRALGEIEGYMADGKAPDTTLLYGVTASGKTLLYYELVRRTLQSKKTALLLVPEIALATQMIYRFKQLFGERVGVIHSGLSDTERQLQWQAIRNGEYDLVVGTRSAVFAPLMNIGLIIVDEEQEQTYLSEQNPRYHALSVAAFRAKYHHAHCLLASATPSVERYHAASEGRINLVALHARYQDMPLPRVEVVDMRSELLSGNGLGISQTLYDEILLRLEKKEQCILLLNRRGYRTVSLCGVCKTIVKCRRCDTALVYHKQSGRYLCHYCGHGEPFFDSCRECGGAIRHTGVGTQKIEEELETLFPEARVLRLDLDSAGRKRALEEKLRAFSEGRYDMIVGTQMIAKGLDFKNVTLAGVLAIDQLLLMPSFRAAERTFSILTQVIGRSGRGEKEGEAVIQTIDPGNPIIRLAAKQDYPSFFESEIASRKLHLYPPFCAVGSVGFIGQKEAEAERAANGFKEIAERLVKAAEPKMPIRLLGPSPMRIAYANELYRYKITLKSRGDRAFREMIRAAAEEYHSVRAYKEVRMYVNFYDDGDL